MTEKRRYARYSCWLSTILLAGVVAACSSAPTEVATASSTAPVPANDAADAVLDPTTPQAPTPSPRPKLRRDRAIEAEVSVPETMDGTIVLLTARVPLEYAGQPVVGEFGDIDFPFFKDGVTSDGKKEIHRAVLGVPYDQKPGENTVRVRVGQGDDSRGAEVSFNVIAGNYASETLKVDSRRVRPQNPKDLARIRKEMAEIGQVYSSITAKKYWSGPFELPVRKIQAVTSSFGTRRVYNGIQKSAHLGLDFKAPTGTRIYSSGPGKVVLAKNLFFTGNTVIIDHGYGVLTLYAHLSKLRTKKGKEVKSGQLIGLSGRTGRVTGPHLHWMAVVHKQKVNPLGLIQVMR